MSNCLSCGTKTNDGEYTCISCKIKYGQSHVIVPQEEYQKLRYKEMMYEAEHKDGRSLN